uniref:Uncharacterized protein n=1 Tax=Sciurus vulgaris TaxID=55149 RepID=A0A8D2D5D4_SCIVU
GARSPAGLGLRSHGRAGTGRRRPGRGGGGGAEALQARGGGRGLAALARRPPGHGRCAPDGGAVPPDAPTKAGVLQVRRWGPRERSARDHLSQQSAPEVACSERPALAWPCWGWRRGVATSLHELCKPYSSRT